MDGWRGGEIRGDDASKLHPRRPRIPAVKKVSFGSLQNPKRENFEVTMRTDSDAGMTLSSPSPPPSLLSVLKPSILDERAEVSREIAGWDEVADVGLVLIDLEGWGV